MRCSQLAFLAILLAAGGCATVTPTGDTTLAKDDDILFVRVGADTSYSQLSRQYLGDERLSALVANENGNSMETPVKAGRVVVLPRRPANASRVFASGYATVPILCYHRFSNSPSTDPVVVTAQAFDAQMSYLANNGYHVVGFDELAQFARGDRLLPDKLVVITIDDGYKSVGEIALPILKRYNFDATLFAYTDSIGGGHALNWQQIAELDRGDVIDVQSHSKTHTSHVRQPEESEANYRARIKKEVSAAHAALKKLLNGVNRYAYPYGDTSPEVVEELQAQNYQFAATVQRGGNATFTHPLLLRRTMIYGQDDLETFKRRLTTFKKVDLR